MNTASQDQHRFNFDIDHRLFPHAATSRNRSDINGSDKFRNVHDTHNNPTLSVRPSVLTNVIASLSGSIVATPTANATPSTTLSTSYSTRDREVSRLYNESTNLVSREYTHHTNNFDASHLFNHSTGFPFLHSDFNTKPNTSSAFCSSLSSLNYNKAVHSKGHSLTTPKFAGMLRLSSPSSDSEIRHASSHSITPTGYQTGFYRYSSHNLTHHQQLPYSSSISSDRPTYPGSFPSSHFMSTIGCGNKHYNSSSENQLMNKSMKNNHLSHSSVPTTVSAVAAAAAAMTAGELSGGNLKKCRARFGLEHQNMWCKPCRRKKKCIRFISETDPEEMSSGTTSQQTGNHHPSSNHYQHQMTHLARQRLANFIDPFIRPIHSSASNIPSHSLKLHSFPSRLLCPPLNTNLSNEQHTSSDFELRLKSHLTPGCYASKLSAFINPSLSSSRTNPMLDLSSSSSSFLLNDAYRSKIQEELNSRLTSSSLLPLSPSSLFSSSRSNPSYTTTGLNFSNCNESILSSRHNDSRIDLWNDNTVNGMNNFYPNWSHHSSAFKVSSTPPSCIVSCSSAINMTVPSVDSKFNSTYNSNNSSRSNQRNHLYEVNHSDNSTTAGDVNCLKSESDCNEFVCQTSLTENSISQKMSPLNSSLDYPNRSLFHSNLVPISTTTASSSSVSNLDISNTKPINTNSFLGAHSIEPSTSSNTLPCTKLPLSPIKNIFDGYSEENLSEPPSKRICNSPTSLLFKSATVEPICYTSSPSVSLQNTINVTTINNLSSSSLQDHSAASGFTNATTTITTSTATSTTVVISETLTTGFKFTESVRFGVADFMGLNDKNNNNVDINSVVNNSDNNN
ncbi:Protein pangolin, isoforms A/H/I/S [Schistosoma japonicum]|nr:Protein pangolin, isoforms A/H/I/S [Schistosoma japonicum]